MDHIDYAGARKRIVILGGGFAGAYAAKQLQKSLPKGWEFTLIDRNNFLLFYPLLVDAGVGTLEPRHVVVPIRDFVRDQDFRMAEVVDADLEKQRVHFRMIGSDLTEAMSYDHLVIGLGSVTRMPPVKGLEQFGFQLKSLADSISLRDRAIQLLELANTLEDAEQRRALLRIVVVGANFTGVELAGEYQEFLTQASESYHNVRFSEISIVVIEIADRILQAIDEDLASYAMVHLKRRGLDIRTQTSVKEVCEDKVILSDGSDLSTYTSIWAAGIAPSPLLDKVDGLPREKGWISTDQTMQVQGFDNVWAIGDLAHVDLGEGKSYGATAQNAVREGTHVAKNIVRSINKERLEPFVFKPLGSLAALGCRTAVAKVFGIKIAGFVAWWLFRTVYLAKMPSWSRRIRIVMDWTTDLFFKRDVVQLGVPRINPSRPEVPLIERDVEVPEIRMMK